MAPSDTTSRHPHVDHPQVTLNNGDPAMLRLSIDLFSWERGDSEIELTLPVGGELSDLLTWALPEQRAVICANLRMRVAEELAAAFEVLENH
jgi:hypothetical protein